MARERTDGGTKAKGASPEPHSVLLSHANRTNKTVCFCLETGVKHLKIVTNKDSDGLDWTATESNWFVEKTTINL